MFKEKTSKKRIATHDTAKDTSTLDARHQTMISSLQDSQANIKSLRSNRVNILQEMASLEKTIKEFKLIDNTECSEYNLLWTSNVKLRELKATIEDTIAKIESADDEIEYFENTGNILYQYYDLIEQQNSQTTSLHEVSTIVQQQRPVAVKGRKKVAPPVSLTILDALCFGGGRGGAGAMGSSTSGGGVSGASNSTDMVRQVNADSSPSQAAAAAGLGKVKVVDKASLVDEYLAQIDLTHVKAKNHDALGTCPRCQLQLTCIHQDGAMVCSDCGYQELLLIEQNRPLVRQPNKEASHYSYKRINHFREWCSQVQGKESTDIPEEIFENILQEIKKEKIHDTRKLTYSKMREIMKRLRINKFYEHINYIINRINGVPTPHFSPELEEKLCSMFKEIQGPFLKHCPKERKNFLSYSYVLYKFFQILNMHEYLRFFPLLKSYSAYPI
jgi:predicted ribosome quality control (RQC) complex YloA/Tae2 family protein